MMQQEYDLVEAVQSEHWWWLGREKLISKKIRSIAGNKPKMAIADIGCGFGANIPLLRGFGDVVGLELKDEARASIAERWGDSVKTINWMSPQRLNKKFDLMLMADVLEHIPNDNEAVEWVGNHLNKGGHVVITVPAHMQLWTQMDDVLDHHRRYNKRTLLKLFNDDFEIVSCNYYNFFLFPVKIAFVLFDRLQRKFKPKAKKKSYNDIPPFGLNKVFEFILKLEILIFSKIAVPIGISLIVVAKKK